MSKDYARSLDRIHHPILAGLVAEDQNKFCADCAMQQPTWASANLGVFLCLNCSGCHRSIGVHITQVRSITMDAWFPEQIETMKNVGNARARAFWEANVPAGYPVPNENSSRAEMDAWIKAKYVEKKFVASQPPSSLAPAMVPRQFANRQGAGAGAGAPAGPS
eukprot:SAG22_NODE_1420_length_4465_cov_7.857994_4_plen_162_part_01